MKTLSIVSALALMSTPVLAGSVSLPPQPVVLPPIDVTADTWSGFYVGMGAGVTKSKTYRDSYTTRKVSETHEYNKGKFWEDKKETGCNGESFNILVNGLTDNPSTSTYTISCEDLVRHTADDGWYDHSVLISEGEPLSWSEDVGEESVRTGSESFTQSHRTLGGFIGYRHQFSNSVVLGAEAGYYDVSKGDNQVEAKTQLGYALGSALPYITSGFEFNSQEITYGVGLDYKVSPHWVVGVEAVKFGDNTRVLSRVVFKF